MKFRKNQALLIALFLLLEGCATRSEPLYCWGDYEDQLYSHFKGEAPEKEILAMEEMMNQCRDSNAKLPPGFYAHLGLLYDRTGNQDEAHRMLELEKQNFPESTQFIDNLNSHFAKASRQ